MSDRTWRPADDAIADAMRTRLGSVGSLTPEQFLEAVNEVYEFSERAGGECWGDCGSEYVYRYRDRETPQAWGEPELRVFCLCGRTEDAPEEGGL